MLEVPNAVGLVSRLKGARWWYDFEHPWSFSEDALRRVLNQSGFRSHATLHPCSIDAGPSGLAARLGFGDRDAVWGRHESGTKTRDQVISALEQADEGAHPRSIYQRRSLLRPGIFGDQLRLSVSAV